MLNNILSKIAIGAIIVTIIGTGGLVVKNKYLDPKNNDNSQKILADYQKLLEKAEKLKIQIGDNCNDLSINKQIIDLEKELAFLNERKKKWLDNIPELPDIENKQNNTNLKTETNPEPCIGCFDPDNASLQNNKENSDSFYDNVYIPELPDKIYPELPDIENKQNNTNLKTETNPEPCIGCFDPDNASLQNNKENSDSFYDNVYIPELPEISEDNKIPSLPELEAEVEDLKDPKYQMEIYEQKINNILNILKNLCKDNKNEINKPKIVSDKCEDACKRDKICNSYTENVTKDDLEDGYNTCMEECLNQPWSKSMIKCINSIEIKNPNDCVKFVECRLPQFYNEKYNY